MTGRRLPSSTCAHPRCGQRIVLCAEGWEHVDHHGDPAGEWRVHMIGPHGTEHVHTAVPTDDG